MRFTPSIFAVATLVLLNLELAATRVDAQQPAGNDLRDIRIGMAVTDFPAAGYANFACTNDQGHAIAAWSDWPTCPADKEGLRAIRFDYDPSTSREGTMVAGHPAILTLLVDDKGLVAGLRIETDPKARLYIRKKAFFQRDRRSFTRIWTARPRQRLGYKPFVGVRSQVSPQ